MLRGHALRGAPEGGFDRSFRARVPVADAVYRFGKLDLCADDVGEKLGGAKRLLVFYDLRYEWKMKELGEFLRGGMDEVIVGKTPCKKDEDDESNHSSGAVEFVAGGLSVTPSLPLSAYSLLYETPEVPPRHKQMSDILLNLFSGPNPTASCFVYSPPARTMTEMTSLPRPLSRRYFLVQKSKLVRISAPVRSFAVSRSRRSPLTNLRSSQANIVAIVVISHSVVKKLHAAIQDSGRGYYVVVGGKLNLPKLANFGEIVSYVLLGCPEFVLGVLEKSREFHAPVITPFELSVVLEKREWDKSWSADFAASEWDSPAFVPQRLEMLRQLSVLRQRSKPARLYCPELALTFFGTTSRRTRNYNRLTFVSFEYFRT